MMGNVKSQIYPIRSRTILDKHFLYIIHTNLLFFLNK